MLGHRSVALGGLLLYPVRHVSGHLHLGAGYLSNRSFDYLLHAPPFSMYNLDRLLWNQSVIIIPEGYCEVPRMHVPFALICLAETGGTPEELVLDVDYPEFRFWAIGCQPGTSCE